MRMWKKKFFLDKHCLTCPETLSTSAFTNKLQNDRNPTQGKFFVNGAKNQQYISSDSSQLLIFFLTS